MHVWTSSRACAPLFAGLGSVSPRVAVSVETHGKVCWQWVCRCARPAGQRCSLGERKWVGAVALLLLLSLLLLWAGAVAPEQGRHNVWAGAIAHEQGSLIDTIRMRAPGRHTHVHIQNCDIRPCRSGRSCVYMNAVHIQNCDMWPCLDQDAHVYTRTHIQLNMHTCAYVDTHMYIYKISAMDWSGCTCVYKHAHTCVCISTNVHIRSRSTCVYMKTYAGALIQ